VPRLGLRFERPHGWSRYPFENEVSQMTNHAAKPPREKSEQAASSTAPDQMTVEAQIQRYRAQRHRKLQRRIRPAPLDKNRVEQQHMLEFAQIWAPFGGVPHDETFIKFGMTKARFMETLWQILEESDCDADLRQRFVGTDAPAPRHR